MLIFSLPHQIKLILQAQDFRQQGTKIRRKMWFQNMKIKLIVLGIIIALILIIVLSVCGGFNCGKWWVFPTSWLQLWYLSPHLIRLLLADCHCLNCRRSAFDLLFGIYILPSSPMIDVIWHCLYSVNCLVFIILSPIA